MVGERYGDAEKELMTNLLSMGHTKVEDLRDAYRAKFKQAARLAPATNGTTNGDTHDDEDDPFADSRALKHDDRTGLYIKSLVELDEALCRMINAELVSSVTASSFRSWEDTRKAIEDEIKTTYFSGGVRGAKGKEEYATKLSKRLREVRDEPLSLKRKIQAKMQMNKRRKLSEWNSVNSAYDDEDGLVVDVGLIRQHALDGLLLT